MLKNLFNLSHYKKPKEHEVNHFDAMLGMSKTGQHQDIKNQPWTEHEKKILWELSKDNCDLQVIDNLIKKHNIDVTFEFYLTNHLYAGKRNTNEYIALFFADRMTKNEKRDQIISTCLTALNRHYEFEKNEINTEKLSIKEKKLFNERIQAVKTGLIEKMDFYGGKGSYMPRSITPFNDFPGNRDFWLLLVAKNKIDPDWLMNLESRLTGPNQAFYQQIKSLVIKNTLKNDVIAADALKAPSKSLKTKRRI